MTEQQRERGMTAEQAHDKFCGDHGTVVATQECEYRHMLLDLAAAEYARGREECEKGLHPGVHGEIRTVAYETGVACGKQECAATHAALEREARDAGQADTKRAYHVTLDKYGAPPDEWPCLRIGPLVAAAERRGEERARRALIERIDDILFEKPNAPPKEPADAE